MEEIENIREYVNEQPGNISISYNINFLNLIYYLKNFL